MAKNARRRMWLSIGAYAFISSVWTYAVTVILTHVISNQTLAQRLISYPGIILIALTSLMMFLVMSRMVRRISLDQEKLARREWLLNLQFERMPLVCIVLDARGIIKSWNPYAEKVFGYTAEEAVGRHANIFVADSSKAEALAVWKQLLAGENQTHIISENVTKVGKIIICEWTNTPLIDGTGLILGVLSMAQDITEKRQASEELRTLERELQHTLRLESLGALAGGVAHDINNILAAIVSVAEVVEMMHQDNEKLHKHMSMVMRAAFRGRDLVRGLTSFARKEVASHAPVDLNELATNEIDLLSRTTRHMIEIKTDFVQNIPMFEGDETAITNALMNLCVNSLDAMPEGGALTISTKKGDDWVQISVQDTGTGMTPEVRQRALEPFFTTKGAGEGTGLGLSMMYGTVRAHGGEVFIDTAVGVGTTITMRFPTSKNKIVVTQPILRGAEQAIENLFILLVDDDELFQVATAELMQGVGHDVVVVPRGQEAVDYLRGSQKEPDLVVLDINMPGITGLEALKRIREFSNVPVVVTSGYLENGIEDKLRNTVNIQTLAKPFSLEELKRIFIWAMRLR